MDDTDVWMLGVGLFGAAFYALSIYYGRRRRSAPDSSDT